MHTWLHHVRGIATNVVRHWCVHHRHELAELRKHIMPPRWLTIGELALFLNEQLIVAA